MNEDDLDRDLHSLGVAIGELADTDQRLARQLTRLITVVVDEATKRKSFARALSNALATPLDDEPQTGGARPRPSRRSPGVLDPFEVYARGEDELRRRLGELTVEQLKDIVAEHAMDRDRLAMKWKAPERLVDRVVDTVRTRTVKGNVFRT